MRFQSFSAPNGRREREVNGVKAQIERQIESLLAYRKSLIHECVTGQRRVTEADVAKLRERKPRENMD